MRSLACCAVLLLASVLGSTGETSSGHSPWFSGCFCASCFFFSSSSSGWDHMMGLWMLVQ